MKWKPAAAEAVNETVHHLPFKGHHRELWTYSSVWRNDKFCHFLGTEKHVDTKKKKKVGKRQAQFDFFCLSVLMSVSHLSVFLSSFYIQQKPMWLAG